MFPNHPHTQRGHQYALDVVEKRILACKWVRLACKRHLSDLEKSETDAFPYYFDPQKSEKMLRFLSLLPHVKGEWRGQKLTVEPWQAFIFMNLFGWVSMATGKRRFRNASVYVPRKNGKSLLAGGLGLFMLVADGEKGAEVYSMATTMEQAWACWKPAREMVDQLPALQAAAKIRLYGGKNPTTPIAALVLPDASVFKPLTGSPGDGQSPSCAILDELHEWEKDDGLQTMRTGMGARSQPILFIISTAGTNLSGPCIDDWRDCEKLLEGAHEDETKFAVIYTIDDGQDWTSEDAIRMANPNYGISVNPVSLRADQLVAARDVTKQAHFKTKHLNLFVAGSKSWLNIEKWKNCEDSTLKLSDFHGEACWLGIDAASKTDLYSLALMFRRGPKVAFFTRSFLPEDTAKTPENKRFMDWAEAGWLTLTPGARVDEKVVEDAIREIAQTFNVQEAAYDPREMNQLALRLAADAGYPLIEVPQSPAMLSSAYKEMEALVESQMLVVQPDPCLRWQASNCQLKEARGGHATKLWFITKARHRDKIDGMVSGAMALSRLMLAKEQSDWITFL
jgi:phage terminase large subunit-like protein